LIPFLLKLARLYTFRTVAFEASLKKRIFWKPKRANRHTPLPCKKSLIFHPADSPLKTHHLESPTTFVFDIDIMVSASKAAREAKRAAEGKAPKKTVASRSKAGSKTASGASSVAGDETPPLDQDIEEPATSSKNMDEVKRLADQMDKHGLSDRVTTGVLSSLKQSRDVKITSVSLVFHGRVLIQDTTLELTYGRRYGLLGENGCGKSTLLKAIDKREYPIPDHVDIYLLNEGAPPSDLGALEWVVKEAENEMDRLDKEAERILEEDGPESPLLMDLYEV
jgi:ATP-binding cassette subfamily F protein 2